MKFIGQGTPNPCLHRFEEGPTGEAHELCHGLFDAGGMADAGKILGNLFVADILALDEYAVEIEDESAKPQLRSPNRAVPTRT
jgi:hypothetical protein